MRGSTMDRSAPLLRVLLLALLMPGVGVSLTACGKGDEAATGSEPGAGAVAAETGPPAAGDSLPSISSRGTVAPPGVEAAGGQVAAVDFDLPAGWTSQPPESGMRLAQAEIPGAGGPGQLTVFYFGPGGGGPVEANLQRWIDQIGPEGRSEPRRDSFTLDNGLQVTWVEVAGTLQPSTMGMGPTTEQANSRVMAAVVEGPGGPWFFKATGPDATLTAQRDAFLGLLRSVRPRA
jgi:hypothetical protein